MSEQRIIEARGEKEVVLRELMRDTAGDVLSPVAEIDQMFAVVREHLTELIVSLRGDLEELRRLINDPAPARETSVLAVSPVAAGPPSDRGAVPLAERRGQSAADSFSHVIDSHSGVEIERKFIVSELPPELDRFPFERISQGYLVIGEGGFEVRLRHRGDTATLTVKGGLGRTRREEEVALGPEQFRRLWPLTEGRRVEKVRHLIPIGNGLTVELDSYAGELDGLVTAEVEFGSEARADAFEPPRWLGPEVTDDARYRNARLACDGAPPQPRSAPEPFMLDRRETLTTGIRRIVCGQIDAAIDDLGAGILEDPGEAVHACRKRFKRVRATTRLVRDELGTDVYRRENAVFRDLGRRLSDARDSQALLEALDAHCAVELSAGAFARLRAALAEDDQAAARRLRESAAVGAPIIAELRLARARAGSWSFRDDAVTALAPGLERIYGRGRRAYIAARKNPTDESFHELRKCSKDLWHAAQILGFTAPKTMSTLADRAHRLSNLLGDEHDLAVLAELARRRPECFADAHEAALLQELIARRRRQIQREAIKLARRAFQAKSRRLAAPVRQAGAAHAT
jgi:CYTH domain-containing protein